jgi:hypothetical protein
MPVQKTVEKAAAERSAELYAVSIYKGAIAFSERQFQTNRKIKAFNARMGRITTTPNITAVNSITRSALLICSGEMSPLSPNV